MKRKNTSKRVLRRAKTGAQAALAQKKQTQERLSCYFGKGLLMSMVQTPKYTLKIEKRKEKAI